MAKWRHVPLHSSFTARCHIREIFKVIVIFSENRLWVLDEPFEVEKHGLPVGLSYKGTRAGRCAFCGLKVVLNFIIVYGIWKPIVRFWALGCFCRGFSM